MRALHVYTSLTLTGLAKCLVLRHFDPRQNAQLFIFRSEVRPIFVKTMLEVLAR